MFLIVGGLVCCLISLTGFELYTAILILVPVIVTLYFGVIFVIRVQ